MKRISNTTHAVIVALLFLASSIFAFDTEQQRPQTSRARGIYQTQHSLDSVNQMLRDNIRDGDKLISDSGASVIAGTLGRAGLVNVQHSIESLLRADESTRAIEHGNYSVLLRNALESLTEAYGEMRGLPGSFLAKAGLSAIDVIAKYVEIHIILAERTRLLLAHERLETQLARLKGQQRLNGRKQPSLIS